MPESTTVDTLIMADEDRAHYVAPTPPPAPMFPQRDSIRNHVEAKAPTSAPQPTTVGVRATPPPRFTPGSGRAAPADFPAPSAPSSAGPLVSVGTAPRTSNRHTPFNPDP